MRRRKDLRAECLLILAFGFFFITSSCAVTEKFVKTPIEQNRVADLKGRWAGMRYLMLDKLTTQYPAELTISNETQPLKGKLRLDAVEYTKVYPFENGTINKDGNLIIPLETGISMELTLYKLEGRMKLDGIFYYSFRKGTISVQKVE